MHCALEDKFPRIVSQLTDTWPDGRQASEFLDHLLFLEVERTERHGFTNEVWQELIFLHQLLLLECPPAALGTATDIWATALDVDATAS